METRILIKGGNRGKGRRVLCMAAAVIFLLFSSLTVYAADAKILSTFEYGGDIYCYIRGILELQSDSVIQIGNTVCESGQVSSASLSDSGLTMRTIVLVDNSKSMTEESHEDVRAIIEGMAASLTENEQVKIGTFSNQAEYLCDYTNDAETLNNAAGTIAYNNQDTYLSDVLYDVIAQLKEENACAYTRLLIIADGADENPNGLVNDEVRSYIEKNPYPVYTVGIMGKANSPDLEVMFSFSRASNAEYFLLDGSVSDDDVVSALAQDKNGICLKISPDESIKDGSSKSILLKLNTPEGVVELKTSADMPFGSGVSKAEKEESDSEEEAASKEDLDGALVQLAPSGDSNIAEEEKSGIPVWVIVVIIAAVILLAAAVITVIIVKNNKKKKAGKNQKEIKETPLPAHSPPASKTLKTTILKKTPQADMPAGTGRGTQSLWAGVKFYVKLTRLNNSNLVLEKEIKDKEALYIGHECQDGQEIGIYDDEFLSGRHCELILRGDLLYVKDCSSTNGTKYENMAVYDKEVPVASGGILEIGQYSYRVELEKREKGDFVL